MFDKLLASLGIERKESRALGGIVQLGLGTAVWTPRDYKHLTEASYQRNADVFSCVNLIARSAKQVPWIVYKNEGGTETVKPSLSTPAGRLLTLLRQPNERDTESDFKEATIAYLLLSGNEYIERSGGTEGTPPAFLYPHRPDRFRVIKGNRRNIIGGFEYKVGAEPVRFEPWEILHLRLFNPLDDFYGMSPLEAAAYTIDNSNESSALYKKLLQKGYPPGAIIFEDGGMPESDEEVMRFKRGLNRSRENHEILLLQKAKWQEMGFKPVDSAIFEGKLTFKRDIAAVYGVPSGMIGDTQVKTYANSREERRSLYTEAVIPALTKLRDGLNNWLGPVFDNAFIDFDKDAIDALAEDREVQAKRVSLLFEKGLIKRSEGRTELKYEAIPEEEDGYYSELNTVSGVQDDEAIALDDSEESPDNEPEESGRNSTAGGKRWTSKRINHNGSNNRTSSPWIRQHESSGNSLKAFNLLSEEQKDSHWKSIESRRELWYGRIEADAEERFREESSAVLAAYKDGKEAAALRAVTKQEDAWLKLYKSAYLGVAEDFGRRIVQSLKSDGYEYETKFETDLFTRVVLDFISVEGVKRVTGVLETTKDKIRAELAAGVSAGEGTFELSKRLQSMYREFGNYRAERIARTEVISASNLGSQVAARATNLPLEKEWIATHDNRTRDPHAAAHGQRQSIDKPYSVMGQSLMFPGDSSMGATGGNLICCRCAESYRVKRG